jgi:hypothetical protein
MKTPKIIEGLTILQKYRDEPDGFHTGAEHDCIYAFQTSKPLSQEDLARMIELGWFQEDTDYGDDEETGGDFAAKHYDPEESWCCYT